ncbi:DUF2891 domain-containing protein [Halolamina salifodinae]|uniref:DUF2891 domain-containing protein n=1 Tax=Halolamina salifodinae TaxID=1202767 RepID=A0A8T4GTM1_9EURY|nr:DUF2891 domain-containing protein [Halolamina salifodinae]MBP1985750.1 hypothetical protein [Halolamina salifodinae]
METPDALAVVDATDALAGTVTSLDNDALRRLARHPLESVGQEYPHHAGAVGGPEETVRPREDHPVFYGCYDWHSAVHSHWALIRQLRLFDDHPNEAAIVDGIDARLTPENVEGEVDYFDKHPTFEQPYGWAWLLRLAAELHRWDDPRAARWGDALAPLEARIVDLVESEFLTQSRPFRVGTHGNSAFALSAVVDYARAIGDDALAADAASTAERFYDDDVNAPVAYEPLGWDFLSPTLTEANLMRRALAPAAFGDWLDDFLPDLTAPRNEGFLAPVDAGADGDGGLALHLVGLNLAKGWGLAEVAEAVDGNRADRLAAGAERHLEAGLDGAFTDDYAGSHWLSSFVLYALTRNVDEE